MELIVITLERKVTSEERVINTLFEEGLSTLHVRKPSHGQQGIEKLLYHINPDFHNRIVLHDHFQLVDDFNLKGVHLNRRNPEAPEKKLESISCSCHSFDCLQMSSSFNYMFLSPIFDSISKSGYNRAYTYKQLTEARDLGIINERVYALGGVDEVTISLVSQYNFGGVAVLGALWSDFEQDKDERGVLKRFHTLRNKCNQY